MRDAERVPARSASPARGRRTAGPAGRGLRTVAALAALVVLPACTPMDNVMHAIFGRSMRDQPSFDPYENPLLPAEGSVPFASPLFPASSGQVMMGQPEAWDDDLPPFTMAMMTPPGAPEVNALTNPVPMNEASLARGQVLYDRNCAVCHGADGVSANAPILPKLPAVGAYNLANGAATGFSDGYIYAIIRMGRGLMPSYGHRVTHFDRWHIVNYVRALQAQGGGAGAAPAAGAGQPQQPGAAGDTAGGASGDTTGDGADGAGASTDGGEG